MCAFGEPEKGRNRIMRDPSKEVNRRFRCCAGSVAVVAAALCMVLTPAFAQNLSAPVTGGKISGPVAGDFDKVHVLPLGGPAPRMADGHVDLTGRWYPNSAGRMLQVAYPVGPSGIFSLRPQSDAGAAAFLQPRGGRKIQAPKFRSRRMRSGRHSYHNARATGSTRSHGID